MKKPENERWAVLINEFGEVGVDASLLESVQKMKRNFPKSSVDACVARTGSRCRWP